MLAILTAFTATVRATDLRGRIDGLNPYTQITGPLPGVRVALFVNQNGDIRARPPGSEWFRWHLLLGRRSSRAIRSSSRRSQLPARSRSGA